MVSCRSVASLARVNTIRTNDPRSAPHGPRRVARLLAGLALSSSLVACDADDSLDGDALEWRQGKEDSDGQAEPDPGDEAQGDEAQAHTRTAHVDLLPAPEAVVCGEPFSASASATRPVDTCEGAPFSELYDHAKRQAKELIDAVPCPKSCALKEVWTTAHSWSCFDESDVAAVTVQASGICSAEPTEDHADAIKPSDDEFAAGQWGHEGTFVGPPAVVDVVPPTAPPTDEEPCGALRHGSYRSEPTAQCDDVDFTALHFAALASAADYHDSFTCPLGCTLEPFSANDKIWSCPDDTPIVEVTFDIVCVKL